ncbi:hypothetical protein M5K25_013578 [Dendrobium thyrsiflorum]|uniref:CCT domain-containing protein n=1 Tax=Dendrobium thyrsiflorum TaxID=117978 RepID=A0ABD0UTM3_DENTH
MKKFQQDSGGYSNRRIQIDLISHSSKIATPKFLLQSAPPVRISNRLRFEKKIRYASRKARADSRRRVKGRFVKAGETFDYDPLSQARTC